MENALCVPYLLSFNTQHPPPPPHRVYFRLQAVCGYPGDFFFYLSVYPKQLFKAVLSNTV